MAAADGDDVSKRIVEQEVEDQSKPRSTTPKPGHDVVLVSDRVRPGDITVQPLNPLSAGSDNAPNDLDHKKVLSEAADDLQEFDWLDFQGRYEQALREADGQEAAILGEVESLSTYFRAWASAASTHDNERATKRLQTRQRFVNLSEQRMQRKQQHYEQVVTAFENALALLRSS